MNGVIVWEGPSQIDGAPIVMIATGLSRPSENAKTGALIQTWIMRSDISPTEAAASGADRSVCGSCRHRPTADGTCYVTIFQAPASVWRAYQRGSYRPITEAGWMALMDRNIRKGSYGDPAAVPQWVWNAIEGPRQPGYTHRWREAPGLRGHIMASVDTAQEALEARELGWRAFRVLALGDVPDASEIFCPASPEGGNRSSCDRCGLCDGSRGETDRRKNIAIIVHGARRSKFRTALSVL